MGRRTEEGRWDSQRVRRKEKVTQPKGQVRDESADGGAVNKRGDWMCAEGGGGVCSNRGRRRKELRRGTAHLSIPLPPFILVYITPNPPIPFRDNFTLRISSAGDCVSNPFPDAFLIVQECKRGWRWMGLRWWVSQRGGWAHLHGVIRVSEVRHRWSDTEVNRFWLHNA